ncbi:MAG: hypothetical protein JNJ59_23035, partial [Deltaproteobacteria bacterium]|nr:hypothetical protein [Deltaproteobacteria bacterium]
PSVKVFTVIFPLVNFLWIGGLMMLIGSVICLSPRWVGRTISSFVSGRRDTGDASDTNDGDLAPAAARVALPEVAPTPPGGVVETVARVAPLFLAVGLLAALASASPARAASFDRPEPSGFAPPRGDATSDFLATLDCGCPVAPGVLRPSPLGDASCACPEAAKDRAVAADVLSQQSPSDIASGRAKYLAYDILIGIDSRWETRVRYEPAALERLLKTIRTTCPGEYLMTLDATRATCSHRMKWVHTFRLLLAAGASYDDIFAFYLADNNATQEGGPWPAHVLKTSDEQVVSFWLPTSIAIAVLGLVTFLIMRNRKRARARGAVDVGPRSDTTLAAAGGLTVNDRARLQDELEAYDG